MQLARSRPSVRGRILTCAARPARPGRRPRGRASTAPPTGRRRAAAREDPQPVAGSAVGPAGEAGREGMALKQRVASSRRPRLGRRGRPGHGEPDRGRAGLGDELVAVVDHGAAVAHPHSAGRQLVAGGRRWRRRVARRTAPQAQPGHLGGDHRYHLPSCGRCSARARAWSAGHGRPPAGRALDHHEREPAPPTSSRLTSESSPR